MSVSTINPPSVVPIDVGALTGINATSTLLDALAPTETGSIALNNNASIVDISDLGELLSATSNFQSLVGTSANGDSATPSFADIATAAQSFVDALNNFQTDSTSTVTNPTGTTFADQLLLEAETTASSPTSTDSTDSFLTNLASVGLDYQDASVLDGNAQFSLNLPTLEAAYAANPTLTATSLEQAFQTLGTAATTVAGQNLSLLSAQSSNLALSSELDTSLLDTTANENASLNSASLIPAATATADAQLQQSLADLALENAIATTTATETAAAQTVAANTAAATSATEVAAAAASNTTTDTADTTDTANAALAQAAIGPTPLDTSTELASDPSVAAAVAAYRLGSQAANKGINSNSGAPDDSVTEVAAASNAGPTTLDLHQNTNNANPAGVTQPASVQSPSEATTENASRPGWHLVDVEV